MFTNNRDSEKLSFGNSLDCKQRFLSLVNKIRDSENSPDTRFYNTFQVWDNLKIITQCLRLQFHLLLQLSPRPPPYLTHKYTNRLRLFLL